MRCDVCHTKIPLGENVCPNCGMVMKKEVQASTHEDSSYKNVIKDTNTSFNTSKRKEPKQKKESSILPIISAIVSIALTIFGVISIISDLDFVKDVDSSPHIAYEEYLDEIKADLENMEYTVDENSCLSLYEDGCEIDIYAYKDKLEYNISYIYSQSEIVSAALDITGSYDESKSQSYQYLDEGNVDELCNYLEFEKGYSLLKDAHSHLKTHLENKNQKYYIGHYDDYEVTVHEKFGEDDNSTLFSYSITK